VKTTFLIRDELYSLLAEESRKTHGTARKMSETLNLILARYFSQKKSLFGTTKYLNTKEYRDEHDRFD